MASLATVPDTRPTLLTTKRKTEYTIIHSNNNIPTFQTSKYGTTEYTSRPIMATTSTVQPQYVIPSCHYKIAPYSRQQ